jgi:hypothetical protein
MGGNAIKKVPVSRINIHNYNIIKHDIYNKLSPFIQLDFLYDVPGKTDFGDLDVIYKLPINLELKKLLIQVYNPEEIVVNGDVTSFSYLLTEDNNQKYFQVDLIKSADLMLSKFFFSYGDVGGIIGTITKFYGVSYSEGLWCNVNKDTIETYCGKKIENLNENNGRIILSKDLGEICKYLDLDYERWKLGFEKKISIFEWIICSSWFNRDIFTNLNKEENHKEKVRPFYKEFNDFIFDEKRKDFFDKKLKRENRQLEAIKYFNKLESIEKLVATLLKNMERRRKFNGNKIICYGFENKEVGTMINNFKEYIISKYYNNTKVDNIKVDNNDKFNEWLDNNNESEVDFELYNFIVQ